MRSRLDVAHIAIDRRNGIPLAADRSRSRFIAERLRTASIA